MKRVNLVILVLVITALWSIVTTSCKKDEPEIKEVPQVTTYNMMNLTAVSVDVEGIIISSGSSDIIYSGICWGINEKPTIEDNEQRIAITVGNFICNITSGRLN